MSVDILLFIATAFYFSISPRRGIISLWGTDYCCRGQGKPQFRWRWALSIMLYVAELLPLMIIIFTFRRAMLEMESRYVSILETRGGAMTPM